MKKVSQRIVLDEKTIRQTKEEMTEIQLETIKGGRSIKSNDETVDGGTLESVDAVGDASLSKVE